jgi:dihydrolipoamide dehydrogenase
MPDITTINLHPQTHPPSSLSTTTYDVISIGSGWAGRIAAARCVKAGLTALVIEKELVGGECPFWACVPSKALLRPPEALDDARHVTGAREKLVNGDAKVNPAAVFARRDEYAAGWDDSKHLVPMVENSGTHLVRGVGRITGVRKVNVSLHIEGQEPQSIGLVARQAVIVNTGSQASIPDIPGLRDAKPWTAREAASSSFAPSTLFIMGGGVVGCEMATIYQKLGSNVVLASRSDELLPRLDFEAGKLVRERLVKLGAEILTSTAVTKVNRLEDGSLTIEVESAGQTKSYTASEILVATGRIPTTQNIGLENLGLALSSDAPLIVDDSLLMTSIPSNKDTPWLYATADVTGRALMSHTSKYHGRVAGNAIIARSKGTFQEGVGSVQASADHYAVPQVIFSDPQVASVGLIRDEAKSRGFSIRAITAPVQTLGANLHAEGYEPGWAQWVVDAQSDVLLGATFVGSGVADLLHASTVAIVGKMTLEQLVHAIPPFPTMSEVYLNLLDAAGL